MSRADKITWMIRICLIVLTLTVAVLVFGPFGGDEEKLGFTDKEAHALAFYSLCTLGLLAMPRLRKWDVMLACLAFGGAIEVIQPFVGRDGNLPDWLADSFGVMLAIVPMTFENLRSRIRGSLPATPRRRASDRSGRGAVASLNPFAKREASSLTELMLRNQASAVRGASVSRTETVTTAVETPSPEPHAPRLILWVKEGVA